MSTHAQEAAGVILSAGCDWIAAYGAGIGGRESFAAFADGLVGSEREAARSELAASRFGFAGWKGEHWFYGVRHDGACICLSGPQSVLGAEQLIRVATNVSRIDWQVTFAYDRPVPNLALAAFTVLESSPTLSGRPFGFGLINTKPEGQTLTINKRISDSYGRLYDKGVESGLCSAGRIWRAELECKRGLASRSAMDGLKHGNLGSFANGTVQAFYSAKGLKLGWPLLTSDLASQTVLERPKPDSLEWLRKTVSLTVARQIKAHGLPEVLSALMLDQLVDPKVRV